MAEGDLGILSFPGFRLGVAEANAPGIWTPLTVAWDDLSGRTVKQYRIPGGTLALAETDDAGYYGAITMPLADAAGRAWKVLSVGGVNVAQVETGTSGVYALLTVDAADAAAGDLRTYTVPGGSVKLVATGTPGKRALLTSSIDDLGSAVRVMQVGGARFALSPSGALVVSGGAPEVPYADKLVSLFGATEVWRLVDIESGTAVPAHTTSARNGTSSGLTLQDGGSPVSYDTLAAPRFNAATPSYCNISSASIISAFNTGVHSVGIWAKIQSAQWTDGVQRMAFVHARDSGNLSHLTKAASSNTVNLFFRGSFVTDQIGVGSLSLANQWFHFGYTVDTGADQLKAYLNGVQIGTTQTGIGAWAGAMTQLLLGIYIDLATLGFTGHLAYAHVKYGGPVWTAADFAGIVAAANP